MTNNNEEFAEMTKFAETTVGLARTTKQILCDVERGPMDNPPMLVWHTQDDVHLLGLPTPNDTFPAYEVLASALSGAFTEFGVPRFVSVIVEAYATQLKDKSEADDFERGDLQKQFQKCNPNVVEVISIVTFDMGGKMVTDMLYYGYDDAGRPVFEEVIHDDDPVSGGMIIDVIEDFCSFVRAE